jgi:hypothetical protein
MDAPAGCPKITTITCADDLFQFLKDDAASDDGDRLCIIKYYASWCKSCAKFGMKFKQLAMTHGDLMDDDGNVISEGQIRFAQAEYSENRILCKAMGITKLPFVQIYKAGVGKIDEFVCGPRDFQEKVKRRVDELLEMSDDELRFQREMEEGQSLSNSLLPAIVLNKEDSSSAKEGSNPNMV